MSEFKITLDEYSQTHKLTKIAKALLLAHVAHKQIKKLPHEWEQMLKSIMAKPA